MVIFSILMKNALIKNIIDKEEIRLMKSSVALIYPTHMVI